MNYTQAIDQVREMCIRDRDHGGVSADSGRILEHHRSGNRISRQYRQTAAVGVPLPDAGRRKRDFLCSVLHLCAAGIAYFWNGESDNKINRYQLLK